MVGTAAAGGGAAAVSGGRVGGVRLFIGRSLCLAVRVALGAVVRGSCLGVPLHVGMWVQRVAFAGSCAQWCSIRHSHLPPYCWGR